MNHIITLIENAKPAGIVYKDKGRKQITWLFGTKANHRIAPNEKIEISSGRFCWPSLAVVKKDNVAKSAVAGNRMSFVEKYKIAGILRQHAKKMTKSNKFSSQEVGEAIGVDLGFKGSVSNAELDAIEYNNG